MSSICTQPNISQFITCCLTQFDVLSNKIMPCSKQQLQQVHPIKDEICVMYQRCTWCTWHHPSHSCHHPESRVLWTGDTLRPRSCLTEVSGMNCSLEWAWRFGQCAYGGFGLQWEGGGRGEGATGRKGGRGRQREEGRGIEKEEVQRPDFHNNASLSPSLLTD